VRQVLTGVLCIPFSGTLHGPTDRAAFGLVEAFGRGDVHGEDVVLELDSRPGLNWACDQGLSSGHVAGVPGLAGHHDRDSVGLRTFESGNPCWVQKLVKIVLADQAAF
jgi:hypothetical protein